MCLLKIYRVDTKQSDVQITKKIVMRQNYWPKKNQPWSVDGKLIKINFEDKCLVNIKTKLVFLELSMITCFNSLTRL